MGLMLSPEHMEARMSFTLAEAERWRGIHATAIAGLPDGTTVIIDVVSGELITGTTWIAADDAYVQKYGSTERMCFTFTVGRPNFVAGGIWKK
jgi:hypothetical protein